MGNISYFCIVKRFEYILKCVAFTIFLFLTDGVAAQHTESTIATNMDSVEISLLTCNPRQKVYSLYGHTAIRIQDKAGLTDIAVNYGMFSFGKPFFILRFVFGLTDYEMGIEDFETFRTHYAASGTGVRQQTLNLTKEEKQAVIAAIIKNYEPQNRVYRYNYFYDNCTTRARDILIKHINGTVRYMTRNSPRRSYRQMIHSYNEHHRWARFGNDLLLGVKADMPTNRAQQQFLPDNLRKDFDNAVVVGKNGEKRPLVARSTWIARQDARPATDGFPLSPTACAVAFAVIITALSFFEWRKKKMLWGIDALLMSAAGLCGIILFAMVFSEHPTVEQNFQILVLNPFSLVFLYPSVKKMRNGRLHAWIVLWPILIVLFIFAGLFQDYAEGMYYVASSLLIRYILKTDQIVRNKK